MAKGGLGMQPENRQGNEPDLRRIGIHPDFWYPLARSKDLKRGKTHLAAFAGEPIVLARTEGGEVFALDDRCAHRRFPLHKGIVCGEILRCAYHAWTYRTHGRLAAVPYLPEDAGRPAGVRSYACQEDYGHVFVFLGDREKAREVEAPIAGLPFAERPHDALLAQGRLPLLVHAREPDGHEPSVLSPGHHGDDQADAARPPDGEGWVESRYRFKRTAGKGDRGASFLMAGRRKRGRPSGAGGPAI